MEIQKHIDLGGHRVGNDLPFAVFGGMNVLEDRDTVFAVAEAFAAACARHSLPWIFKASFDKANRTSLSSPRGPGLEEGLALLSEVAEKTGAAVMTDIHEPAQAAPVAEVAQVLQIPAFLCRQTDLLCAAAKTGAVLNIKKAQFLAPEDMAHVVEKCVRAGNEKIILCERGSSFGYHNLVVDMLGFDRLKACGGPVIFDVTHSLQKPGAGAGGRQAGGRAEQTLSLALSAMAQGLAGLFLEAHPEPKRALCDGPCALPLDELDNFLARVKAVDEAVKS